MILKQNPLISDTFVANSKANIGLDKMNFGLAISLEDSDQSYNYIDPSLYTIEVYFNYIGDKNDDYIANQIFLHNCSKNDFDANIGADYCSECLCPDDYSKMSLSVAENTMWYSDYSYISIKLKICSDNSFCQPRDEILNFLQGKYLSINFLEYFYDMENYENPAKFNLQNSKEVIIDKNLSQYISISLMEVEILQDSNPIFDNGVVHYKTYFQQDSSQYWSSLSFLVSEQESNVTFEAYMPPPLVQMNFWPSLNKRSIVRKYQKLADVLSTIGGLANFLQFVGTFITNLTCYVKILRNISKKINNSIDISDKKNVISQINNPIEKIENEHSKLQVNVFSFSNSVEMLSRNQNDINLEKPICYFKNDKKIDNSIILNIKNGKYDDNEQRFNERTEKKTITKEMTMKISQRSNQRIKLKFSVWEYIKYYFSKSFKKSLNEKNKLIKETENAYQLNFDIILILKRLLDLEKLKAILLNGRQRILFDLTEITVYPRTKEEIAEALSFYQDDSNLENFSYLDNRLIDFYYKNKI